jgi:hypothetical protein
MWRILGEGPEDSFDLAVPGAVTRLGFLQRGTVLPGIAEVRVAAVGEQPPDAGLGRCPPRCPGRRRGRSVARWRVPCVAGPRHRGRGGLPKAPPRPAGGTSAVAVLTDGRA